MLVEICCSGGSGATILQRGQCVIVVDIAAGAAAGRGVCGCQGSHQRGLLLLRLLLLQVLLGIAMLDWQLLWLLLPL